MGEYISKRNARVLLAARLHQTALNNEDLAYVYEDIVDNRLDIWLNEIPVTDVVEVVRCKDCKNSGYQYRDFHGTERVVCWKDGYGICKNANGYCDEGILRDEKDGDEDYAQ